MKGGLLAVVTALVLAPAAHAGGPRMLVGAAEDVVRRPDLVSAKAEMDRLRLAGFDSVRISQTWAHGQTAPSAADLNSLRNAVAAAQLDGMKVILAVHPFGSSQTPLTEESREQFARFTASLARALPGVREFIVGNEPNLNRFWMPQFAPDGSNAAAPAFLALLAKTYDALKAVSPRITVIGVAVSPRGIDRPGTGRDTHSPTKFIRDPGAAYRASGRTLPIMDQFAIHPYQDTSSTPPNTPHPNTTTITVADYGKLVALLGQAFDGTAQPGSTLPILYAEFGVEAQIPPHKAQLYTGNEPATTRPVDEQTQAAYYRQAIQLTFCQPNVRGIMILHTVDEVARDRWQSGVYYADGTAKASRPAVRLAASESRRGVVTRCEGLALTPEAKIARVVARRPTFRLTCDIDCVYAARLERFPARRTVAVRSGRAIGGVPTRVTFPLPRLTPGSYRFRVVATAPVNTGPPATVAGRPFRVSAKTSNASRQ